MKITKLPNGDHVVEAQFDSLICTRCEKTQPVIVEYDNDFVVAQFETAPEFDES